MATEHRDAEPIANRTRIEGYVHWPRSRGVAGRAKLSPCVAPACERNEVWRPLLTWAIGGLLKESCVSVSLSLRPSLSRDPDDRSALVTPTRVEEDAQYEAGLRPRRLERLHRPGSRARESPSLDCRRDAARRGAGSRLLYGPPGLGKTTLAYVIANELGVPIRTTSGPVIEKPGDLAGILSNLQKREVLFIDEIHRLAPEIEEILYPAMEDFELDIVIGQGPGARSVKVPIERFTLVGATTRAGLLTSPLRGAIRHRSSARLLRGQRHRRDRPALGAHSRRGDRRRGASEIARRSRGTPRIANRLLRRVRDYAQVRADGRITLDVAHAAMEMLEVDRARL